MFQFRFSFRAGPPISGRMTDALSPTLSELYARARNDLRMGVPVVLGGALVAAVETLTPARLSAMQAAGAVLVVTNWRAHTLKARAYDEGLARIKLPKAAALPWVHAVADPTDDLRHPMKGPFETERGGDTAPHRAAVALAKAARLLPAVLVAPAPPIVALDLTTLPLLPPGASPLADVISARLPIEVSDAGRLHIFRPDDGGEEHYAVEIGTPDRAAPVLTRLHSACFTGDVLGSLKCDCGPQLHGALAQMGREGAGDRKSVV